MNALLGLMLAGTITASAAAEIICDQQPAANGGVVRWSQLWQDPGPNGNDLNGDSVCFADVTLDVPKSISHLEWWGSGACELGFQIEVWKQDPGTIAYQPYGVFYYGGNDSIEPEARFRTTAHTATPVAGGLTHYALDLQAPIALAANTPTNPRWFICVIGLTHQAYATWNWAQGTGGSSRTYQFVRGEGPMFRSLGDGRALVVSTPAPCPADFNGSGSVTVQDIFDDLAMYFAGCG